jgi:NAD(P)-dependent dehydrogenase (short-subunit alcohol dehydrogenase family)
MSAAAMPTATARRGLEGTRAVVTGGAGGIGFAIARRLDSMGVTVTLVGRGLPNLQRALRELDRGRPHGAIACDVGDSDAVTAAFETLARQGRSPQILINNAGMATSAKFADLSDPVWNDTLRVNLTGTFHCTRAALPGLMALPFGRIVNIASTAGLIGYPHVAAYCAAKHGVIGLTRALATELARTQITVNAVCPGYTDTGMVDEAIAAIVRGAGRSESDAREALLRRNPQRRLVMPDEVAATVAWLCLPESQSINGQAISLSGGEVMTG